MIIAIMSTYLVSLVSIVCLVWCCGCWENVKAVYYIFQMMYAIGLLPLLCIMLGFTAYND